MVRVTMGTMSASDAAPLPRLGEVFFDVRGDSRTMRVSWYADTGVAVFSIWQADTCTGTFRLPIPELPRMVEALTQGPPGRAGSGSRTGGPGPRQADPGPSTATMGPGSMPVPVPGRPAGDYPPPYRDHEETPLDRGRPGPLSAGYPGFAPAGYPDPSAGPYQGPAYGGQHEMPADGYYQEPAAEGHPDLPPGGYYQGPAPADHRDLPPGGHARSAAGGYQDAGYQDAGYQDAPGRYEESSPAAPADYQDFPPQHGYGAPYARDQGLAGPRGVPLRGGRDLPPGGGYRDVPPGAGYPAPDRGYREPPAAAPPGDTAQFAGGQQDPYPPTGPLPVGRWRTGAPSGEFPQVRPEDGYPPDGLAEDRSPAGRFATGEFAPDGYAADGFAQDEFAADGFPDDPLAGSYQGEAEQGYLPSPPTDMFPAASPSGGYRGQDSRRTGHEPHPADLDHESQYPAGRADRGGPPPDSVAYRPGRSGTREREYGHTRGRS